jgi:N-methylhydantoinase B
MLNQPQVTLRNDPITFEVLRHRLWQINDEQGQTIIRVSGSPVATEGNDFNVAIANADGELLAVGPYIIMHVAAISDVIRSTIAVLGEETIRPCEMYLVNHGWEPDTRTTSAWCSRCSGTGAASPGPRR